MKTEQAASTPTREAVEELKRQWLTDACFDLEETEGFEAYRDELAAFSAKHKAQWANETARFMDERRSSGFEEIERLGELLGVYHVNDDYPDISRKRLGLAVVERLDRIATALEGISAALAGR